MAKDVSGSIVSANVSQSVFGKTSLAVFNGYQIQNTSAGILYFRDDGAPATASSFQIPAGQTYTSPDGCTPLNGLQIMGTSAGLTYCAKVY